MTDALVALRARVHDRLLTEQPEALHISSRWERRVRVREAVARFLADERVSVAPGELAAMVRELSDEITGLGPLEPLLRDPTVTEVMVNGSRAVYVERAGRIEPVPVRFENDRAVLHVIDRIVAPLGLRIDESSPWVDARLPDGSRVHAIVPPLAVHGPALTIRRFSRAPITLESLVALGALSSDAAGFLAGAVRARRNLLVSGGAGAGKTTLLGALSAHIPANERVITIEDAAELRLQREHVVALETRPANVEGRGAVTVRDLVRNALRMRPDRIVVGEVRGEEEPRRPGHSEGMAFSPGRQWLAAPLRLEMSSPEGRRVARSAGEAKSLEAWAREQSFDRRNPLTILAGAFRSASCPYELHNESVSDERGLSSSHGGFGTIT